MRLHRVGFVLLAVLLCGGNAANAAIGDDWEAGKAAFTAGDYESALVFFQSARDAGLDSPAVYYNIGATQFRLAHYREAGQTFELIARRFPKMRGLAEYNLGLVARRMGDDDAATVHFRRARDLSSGDAKLRALASSQLGPGESEPQRASAWSGVAGLRAGNDDNVVLRDEAGLPAGTTTDSPLVDGFVSASGPWKAGGGVLLEAGAYVVRYANADAFNQADIRGGAAYDWQLRDWRMELGVIVSAGTLGGSSFDRKTGLRAKAVRQLTANSALDLHFQHDNINEASAIFAGIAGSRQRFDLRYRWNQDRHHITLRYQAESNDRQDPGVSPRRNRISIDYRNFPGHGFGFEAGLDLRSSDYNKLSTPRSEDLTTIRGALTYTARSPWQLQLEFIHSSNDSTDDSFTYDRNRLTLGAIRFF